MTFGIAEFREFASAFHRHPEWREELHRLVLTDEILGLPAAMRELAEAQPCTEQRVDNLVREVGALQCVFGSTVEEEVASVVEVVLRRKRYHILQSSYGSLPCVHSDMYLSQELSMNRRFTTAG